MRAPHIDEGAASAASFFRGPYLEWREVAGVQVRLEDGLIVAARLDDDCQVLRWRAEA